MKNFTKHLFMLCLFGMISMGAKAEEIPNNQIWYEASEQLAETTSTYSSGLHMDAFNTTIKTHTFSNGQGVITFDIDVTSIGNYAFYKCSGLTSVTIPNSVTSIGGSVFFECSGLTNVTIGNFVTSIGNYAFQNCSGLTSVAIPNSVTSIGWYAFSGCSGLTSVTIPNSVTSIGERAFSGCGDLTSIIVESDNVVYDSRANCNAIIETASNTLIVGCNNTTIPNSVTSIGDGAFEGSLNLTSVEIPNSITSIGSSAFIGCSGLTSIIVESDNVVYDSRANCNAIIETASNTLISGCMNTKIPNSVTTIGIEAFRDCSSLTSIEVPKSVTSIGDYAFSGCYGLTSVTIPNSVNSIGYEAFGDCYHLTSLTIGNSVTSIGNYAFRFCSGLTSVTIPNSVTTIGIGAFYYCHSLTSVTIGNSVTSIGSSVFYSCKSLTSVTIPNSVTSIGEFAFTECSGLTSIEIPNSVTSIGWYAFSGCSGLTSVTIPNSVTSIGDHAFNYCINLRNIIADGVNAPTIGSDCFYYVKNCTLHVPLGSEGAYASNFGDWFGESNSDGNTIVAYSAYSKSNAGVYSFKVWDASSNAELSEGIEKVYVPVEATVNSLQYKRTFNNTDWQALYVPFELDVKNDLADFSVYKISTSSADAINVTLMTEGKTLANTPYLIKAKATGEKAISVSSKKVEVTVENTNSELSDFEIVGTYEKLNYGDISGDWYALKGGKFMKAGEGAYLNPYRFYLKRKASSAKESIDININEPTGITLYENDNDNENGNLYNLNGMRVDSNYKGIVIINGKKYLKK